MASGAVLNRLGGGRSYVRRLRKGSVVVGNREVYLRADLSCGSALCNRCQPPAPAAGRALPAAAHYLLPDAAVLLRHMDLLEDPLVADVVITQTALEELRRRSRPHLERLRAILRDPARHFVVFANENHRQTFTERLPGEAAEERDRRGAAFL